jgi:pyrimidine operon attenuation protein / uracil phosphoribosyltransferase
MQRTLIMSPERVRRTLARLAYEIVERNRGAGTLEIVGIRERGRALAESLVDLIGEIEGRAIPVNELDVSPYRDDRDPDAPQEDTSLIRVDVSDRDVILVDDVLFTGRTARAALDAVVRYGRPRTIQLAVLVDRGHREYPIQPDYVGRFFQTKHKERVIVDFEDGCAVYVIED